MIELRVMWRLAIKYMKHQKLTSLNEVNGMWVEIQCNVIMLFPLCVEQNTPAK